ncbi:MAG: hypothetical protein LBS17_05390 [Actinomycetes bacterium]|nr:hypothetical protein [Actinomycetes bacterium]
MKKNTTNEYDAKLDGLLDSYAQANPDFILSMTQELGKICIPVEEIPSMGFSKWYYENANMFFIERTDECRDSSKCPQRKRGLTCLGSRNLGPVHLNCAVAKPSELVAICLSRHCHEPWVANYCRCLLLADLPYGDLKATAVLGLPLRLSAQ